MAMVARAGVYRIGYSPRKPALRAQTPPDLHLIRLICLFSSPLACHLPSLLPPGRASRCCEEPRVRERGQNRYEVATSPFTAIRVFTTGCKSVSVRHSAQRALSHYGLRRFSNGNRYAYWREPDGIHRQRTSDQCDVEWHRSTTDLHDGDFG